jgi:DNA-binding NtrC family response regulator
MPDQKETTILVVDDESSMRLMLQDVLRFHGFTVLTAPDAEYARQLAQSYKGPIQLVIADIKMPRASGLDLITDLLSQKPEIRALLISGYVDTQSPKTMFGIPFLAKPFSADQLLTAIREVLGGGPPVLSLGDDLRKRQL